MHDRLESDAVTRSTVYIEAIASMYHSGGLVGISHAGFPVC
jgi:hypothetical protein